MITCLTTGLSLKSMSSSLGQFPPSPGTVNPVCTNVGTWPVDIDKVAAERAVMYFGQKHG